MKCEHCETTAILALFDEAPDWFADHLRQCPECQATLAEHRETLDVITPHLPAPAEPTLEREPVVVPLRPRRWWPTIGGSLLAAAAAALAIIGPINSIEAPIAPDSPALAETTDGANDLGALDDELLAIEMELALMDLGLEEE